MPNKFILTPKFLATQKHSRLQELEGALVALNPALPDFLAHHAEYFSEASGGGIRT